MLLARKAEGRPLQRVEALEVLGCSPRSLDRALAQLRALQLVPAERGYTATGGAGTPQVALPGLGTPAAGTPPAPPTPPQTPPHPPLPPRPATGAGVDAGPQLLLHGSVDSVPVSAAEHLVAQGVLDHLNLQLGTSFTADAWRAKIVRRCREHRELDLAGHVAVCEATLRETWWQDRPATPSIIYGSAEQFERCQAALAKRPRAERQTLSADAQRAADQWAEAERLAMESSTAEVEISDPRLQRLLQRHTTTGDTTT